jgi:hypothetical protein
MRLPAGPPRPPKCASYSIHVETLRHLLLTPHVPSSRATETVVAAEATSSSTDPKPIRHQFGTARRVFIDACTAPALVPTR